MVISAVEVIVDVNFVVIRATLARVSDYAASDWARESDLAVLFLLLPDLFNVSVRLLSDGDGVISMTR